MLQRIRNGTTTERDAELVEKLMSSSTDKSIRIMFLVRLLVFFFVAGILLGAAAGLILF